MTSSAPAPLTAGPPRWLHALAVFTVVAALPLLLLGAEVTTKNVGMIDQQGFREPWHLFTVEVWEKGPGFGIALLIEHTHRLAGFVVGFSCIVMAIGLWRLDPRRWVGGLGITVLAAVSVQGLLGGFRVQLNARFGPELALVHGCFAQIAFALLVSLALVTSRSWGITSSAPTATEARSLRWLCLLAVGLLYLQIVLGALVRRKETQTAPRLHLLVAFVVTALLMLLVRSVYASHRGRRLLTRAAAVLVVLLGGQLFLGSEAWLARFRTAYPNRIEVRPLLASRGATLGEGGWAGFFRAVFTDPGFVRSLHFLVGALLFALVVSMTLYAFRGLAQPAGHQPVPTPRLEEAA
ncbi:MAG: COX15/CtaA family protein [Planctomycetes bacterium]|nr:COX15/CtaA family protein [Planctomycetota bacterium]